MDHAVSLSGIMVSSRCHCGTAAVLCWLPLMQLCWSCVIHLVPPHFRTRLKHLYLNAVEFMWPPPFHTPSTPESRVWFSNIQYILIIFIVSTFCCIPVWSWDWRRWWSIFTTVQCFCCLGCCGQVTAKDKDWDFISICVLPSPPKLKVLIHLIRRCSIQRCLMSDIFRHQLSQALVWVRVPSWTGSDKSDSGVTEQWFVETW